MENAHSYKIKNVRLKICEAEKYGREPNSIILLSVRKSKINKL